MVVNVILNILAQLMYTVGAIIIFGLIIAICNRIVYRLIGSKSLLIATGAIGTPLHELSHAGMCIIFGHKITEIKLFDPHSTNGTLGYVKHAYNRKNIYHVIGNFFIGVAPVMMGSLILIFLQWLLVPMIFDEFIASISTISADNNFMLSTLAAVGNMITAFFSLTAINNWAWWLFIILGISIALHMELSVADIKGAIPGLLVIISLSIIINVICALVSIDACNTLTRGVSYVGAYIIGILIISSIFAVIATILSLIIRGIQLCYYSIRAKLKH